MPDIAMCGNEDCPSAKECYRFRAKPSDWQSYMDFQPPPGEDRCGDFWPLSEASSELRAAR